MKLIFLFIFISFIGYSQGYTSYFTGNSTDVSPIPEFGICMMGGATEHDNAMRWLLEKANGGDVVVLRSSGSDGYNDYFYSELGVSINSVETLVITSIAGATNPYVLDKVSKAEMIWFAGGDQWNYYSYFKDNALEDLINYHVNFKNAPIGGTSAGMAILGNAFFTAQNGTVTSAQALNNPYHPNITIDGYNGTPTGTFLNIPFLQNVLTDSHYDNPDRRGRHAVFLARLKNGFGTNFKGIACNEYVAVCVDAAGKASVFGDYPNYQEFAYFIKPNCIESNTIENCQAGEPLTWNFMGQALKVYKVPGTMNGTNYFDVQYWDSTNNFGGSWEDWGIANGVLTITSGTYQDCVLNNNIFEINQTSIFPNPVQAVLNFKDVTNGTVSIYNLQGKILQTIKNFNSNLLDVSFLVQGVYLLQIETNQSVKTLKFIKSNN